MVRHATGCVWSLRHTVDLWSSVPSNGGRSEPPSERPTALHSSNVTQANEGR